MIMSTKHSRDSAVIEFPQPDLRDRSGRARRLVLGVLIGFGVGWLAYVIANTLIDPEPSRLAVHRRMSRDTFVGWVALVSGVVSLVVAVAVQNRVAKQRSDAERLPRATVR
ncbi:hypothetical protein BH11MYX2_BH11MYX2_11870 [soil metagenome]